MPAAAPSESWEALPAVIVPSRVKAAGKEARRSAVVSGRMPSSSVRPFSGAISSARRSLPAAARACDSAAKASWSARETPSRAFSASDSSPIPTSWIEQYRPSWTITSIIGSSPSGPAVRTWTACGAPVIESKPPTSTHVASPSRSMPAASPTAERLARQTSLTVMPGVWRAMPPASAARRPGFCPFAAWRTLPSTT